jgi:hypothetical protein
MPTQNDKLQMVVDIAKESSTQILALSKITSGHAMALKILGATLFILGTAISGVIIKIIVEGLSK